MAKHVEQRNVIEMQCAGAAEEQKKKNLKIILKLMRFMYFMAKNRIPHSTTYKEGGRHLKPQKFENIFVAVITFFPFFCANYYYTSLLLFVCALR